MGDQEKREPGRAEARRDGARLDNLRRRLGPLEYTLLILIAVGIAITIAMAIVDPAP